MPPARSLRTIASEVFGVGVPVSVGVGFILGLIAGHSLAAAANGVGLASAFAVPICALLIWGAVSNEGPGWCTSAAVVLALAGVVTILLVLHPSGSAQGQAPGPVPDAGVTTPTGQQTLSPASPAPTPLPTTSTAVTPPASGPPAPVGWPTSAQDGSSAMYVYFGAEFYYPDWVSCEQTYCLAGEGQQIHVYTEHPIKRVNTFNGNVPDPYQKLIALHFTPAQAKALLKED